MTPAYLILISFALLGAAVLTSTAIVYQGKPQAQDDWLRRSLRGVGWTLIVVGVGGGFASCLLWVSVPLFIIGGIVATASWLRFRRLERDDLLWAVMTAAEKGLPLSDAAWAFAAERNDGLGRKARRLATLLEHGSPVSVAFDQAAPGLSTPALVALRIGAPTGRLGAALREAIFAGRDAEIAARAMLEQCSYWILTAFLLKGVLVFIFAKPLPFFMKMLQEFEIPLPAATERLVEIGQLGARWGAIVFPIAMSMLLLFVLHYVGLLPRDFAPLRRLAFPFDRPLVLRVLGWSVQAGRPMPAMLELLSREHPKSLVRRRAKRAAQMIADGRDWCDSLQTSRLARPADVAVLRAAQRAGNLAWALDELADSHLRRLAYRLRCASTVLFPFVTAALGAAVYVIAVAFFLPLVRIIESLT